MDMKTAMRNAGIEPPTEDLIPSGRWERYGSDDQLAYILYDAGAYQHGSFGDWRIQVWHKWQSKQDSELSQADLRAIWEQRKEDAVEREQDEIDRPLRAHRNATREFNAATEAEASAHSYIAAKGIQTHGVRASGETLYVPMYDSVGKLCGTQHIWTDKATGKFRKTNMRGGISKGASYELGGSGTICIAEGFATAASIYESTGHMSVCSFGASNMVYVAALYRGRYPDARIVICADNDEHGVGQKYASRAAEAIGASVVCPPAAINDFNDLHKLQGLIAVRDAIDIIPGKFSFKQYSMNNHVDELRAQMLNDVFVMDGVAILGQITAIYAPPNTGKTLITISMLIDSVKAGRIKGEKVFYVNADDSFNNSIIKTDIFKAVGIESIAPGRYGFESKNLIRDLDRLVREDSAKGAIFVLDTLKKFTDLMDKKSSSAFMTAIRGFVSHGGTMILLAHTNKRRDGDNKLIAGGTSDVIDDADCAYVLDEKDASLGDMRKTVVLENKKSRGNVIREVCFSYSLTPEGVTVPYIDLIESVERHKKEDIYRADRKAVEAEALKKDWPVIEIVKEAIGSGITKKTELVNAVHSQGGGSKIKIRSILDKYSGQHWGAITSGNNASVYHILSESAATAEQYLMWKH